MKIQPNREALLSACELAFKAVPNRTTKPILQCLKLSAESDGKLTVFATDTEVALTIRLDGVVVDRPGDVCVSADSLTKLLAKIDDEFVRITATPTECEVAASFDLFTLPVKNPDNMPGGRETVSTNEDELWTVDAGEFGRMLDRAKYAVSDTEDRFTLTGLYLGLDKTDVVASGTDKNTLSIVETKATSGSGKWSGILPMKTVGLVSGLAGHFSNPPSPLVLVLTKNAAEFQFPNATLTTRLLEGSYPPFRSLVPKSFKMTAPVNADLLAKACQKVRIVLNKDTVKVNLKFSANRLEFTSQSDKGKALTAFPIQYDGDEFEVPLTVGAMADLARASNAVTLQFKAVDLKKPVLFTTDDGFTALVMPMVG